MGQRQGQAITGCYYRLPAGTGNCRRSIVDALPLVRRHLDQLEFSETRSKRSGVCCSIFMSDFSRQRPREQYSPEGDREPLEEPTTKVHRGILLAAVKVPGSVES
jgi:hypothetical protein